MIFFFFWGACVENLRLVIIELQQYLEGFWFHLEGFFLKIKYMFFAWSNI